MPRIDFLNPFGTPAYDALIAETLTPYARPDTELVIRHLVNSPQNIDYYWPKALVEEEIYEHAMAAEAEGFDAIIVGCCYDPGVRVARELVDIPVVGPLEASLQMAAYFGHSTTVITDHRKAVPYIKDLVRLYGYEPFSKDVDCIDWWVTDMIKSPDATAEDAYAKVTAVAAQLKVESVILGCTIIAGCLEQAIQHGRTEFLRFPIVNPNLAALKMAEALADLKRQGRYNINRSGYYGRFQDHNQKEFDEVRDRFAGRLQQSTSEQASRR
jgi:allantoin racemase